MNVIARMSNMAAVKQVVSRGLGVSILSEQIVSQIAKQEKLRYFHIQGLTKNRTFYMVYNKNICLSQMAEEFIRFVHEQVKQNG